MEINNDTADVPKQMKSLKVGIICNLKKGEKHKAIDAEAEYDNIETVYGIERALKNGGFEVTFLEADEELPQKLMKSNIDIAFNIAEGKNGRGREAQIPALLNLYGIPFTGSDETTLCLALDKAITKRLLQTYDVRTPKYFVLTKKEELDNIKDIEYPVIIKPNAEGSSKGISDVSVVNSFKELKELVEQNFELYSQNMLVEEYIEGREFTVGILGNGDDARVFTPMEIIYKKPTQDNYHVYSYNVKQDFKKFVDYKCPSEINKELEDEMINTSRKIYDALECKDFARIDFRISHDGKVYFIEANPLPGLAPGYSDFPMLAGFCGMEYEDVVRNVLYVAIKRLGIGK